MTDPTTSTAPNPASEPKNLTIRFEGRRAWTLADQEGKAHQFEPGKVYRLPTETAKHFLSLPRTVVGADRRFVKV